MEKSQKIDNDVLLKAALELMQQNEKPLTKQPSKGRAMLYKMPNGETVRARTCNDHVLIAVAESTSENAKLNIEGTHWLLIVMPEVERTNGNIIGYLIPTDKAVDEVRQTHQDWLATNPNTKGGNTTWNIWFKSDGPDKANNYANKWKEYRLEGKVSSLDYINNQNPQSHAGQPGKIKAEVEAARLRIAQVAGVSPEAVKISIDFS